MSKLEALEREIEQLPPEEFSKLSDWMNAKVEKLSGDLRPIRNHSAFLASYSEADEGLYDDTEGR